MTQTYTVRRVGVEQVRPLRHAVLRADRPVEHSVYAEDDHAVHVAAFDADGHVVGCATVFAAAYADDPSAWRLRGMAVEAGLRGSGVGTLVLDAAEQAAREAGARLMWCNARATAIGFYAGRGWYGEGEEFVTEGILHLRMVRDLAE